MKPAIIYLASIRFGFTHQVSFKSWLSLGQISEFGFIILGIGLMQWYVTDESLMSIMVLVGLITIAISSYLTMHNNELYAKVQNFFGKEKIQSTEEMLTHALDQVEIILFGYGRMGSQLAHSFQSKWISHVVIDHNPELIEELEQRSWAYVFADASSVDVYKHMFHPSLKMVVSTIRDLEDDLLIIQEVNEFNPDVIIVVVTNHAEYALELYEAGADYVIMPDTLSANHTTALLENIWYDVDKFLEEKLEHLGELKK